MEGLNVLALFDGMSCGQIALQRAGIPVNKYFASEIDKYAMQVTQHNFPNTIQLGDVTQVFAKDLPKIHLILAGSPCQGFSLAGKQLNFNDPRSKLFFEFVRLVKECQPKYFLLENVKMKYEHEIVISRLMGVNPVEINSGLLSAQNRERLYWTNINQKAYGLFGDMMTDIPQPKDKKLLLRDILETNVPEKYFLSPKMMKYLNTRKANFNAGKINYKTGDDKASCINASSGHVDISDNLIVENGTPEQIAELLSMIPENQTEDLVQIGNIYDNEHNSVAGRVYTDGGKSVTLSALGGGGGAKTGLYAIKGRVRRLTPVECERLQTIPDGYSSIVSDSQRYRMLGNGWTVDVIVHILNHMK